MATHTGIFADSNCFRTGNQFCESEASRLRALPLVLMVKNRKVLFSSDDPTGDRYFFVRQIVKSESAMGESEPVCCWCLWLHSGNDLGILSGVFVQGLTSKCIHPATGDFSGDTH